MLAGLLASGDGRSPARRLTGSPAYFPLMVDSPAVNAADQSVCTTADQIGTTRSQGPGCDIGAIEMIFAAPSATFIWIANGLTVNFTPAASGDYSTFSWDVDGDNNEDYTSADVAHTYDSPGSYTVSLEVCNPNSCSALATQTVTVSASSSGGSGGSGGSGDSADGGGRSGRSAAARIATAPPPARTGETLQRQGYVLSAPHGLGSGVQFQRVDGRGIGIQAVLNRGLRDAVDVWGFVEQGVEVCFPPDRGHGGLLFLDASTAPRTVMPLASELRNGYTCG